MLSESEKKRYNRHLILDKVGIEGQQRLKKARVLVIGAGGLGCPVLLYLTAAGVGNIGIIDFDTVDESNLQRQVVFTTEDIGKNKALTAKERLLARNNCIQITAFPERLTNKNALELFSQYDIIIDGTDNFSTRYLVNDACVLTDKPLVYGAIFKFEGQVTVFNYQNGPTYRCLFPNPPKAGSVPSCSNVGVLGVLPGVIGLQQANEALKIILQIGEVLSEKLTIYNALGASSTTVNITKNDTEISKAKNINFKDYDYDFFCGLKENNNNMKEISINDLAHFLEEKELQILDVRMPWEQPKLNDERVINIPLQEIPQQMEHINKSLKTLVFCQHGVRSVNCIEFLENQGFDNLINLREGIVDWK
ncbi:MAG: molybdopterin-synthase adenylyltransferase MoeB [Flavobacteriales bacterium]|nr:molybdopterin-synthase adenylyltransferase MoeB [Flavobacteriales bacterium]MCW8911898.1 molybdopterin-synthase adenylyltransferase MoeB [Flavobacteriales bacterium]MCW8937358.1 molybdopterin-synthase adenylyltransferase MoeB [Flavobacteriales bacterium]MCW8940602.1 molybdopterin-synthase adenylyltransferase MoeB [Flavobacteriales bacterium]MCW8966933.1 molybdopterin-synthase adenylyltransferase MoeB [Flavobacteriales bacterium]